MGNEKNWGARLAFRTMEHVCGDCSSPMAAHLFHLPFGARTLEWDRFSTKKGRKRSTYKKPATDPQDNNDKNVDVKTKSMRLEIFYSIMGDIPWTWCPSVAVRVTGRNGIRNINVEPRKIEIVERTVATMPATKASESWTTVVNWATHTSRWSAWGMTKSSENEVEQKYAITKLEWKEAQRGERREGRWWLKEERINEGSTKAQQQRDVMNDVSLGQAPAFTDLNYRTHHTPATNHSCNAPVSYSFLAASTGWC